MADIKMMTLKELSAAYKSGDIHKDRVVLIDNDDVWLHLPVDRSLWSKEPTEEERDGDVDTERVWCAYGEREALNQAFEALGIPAEGV
jgi:hypothetical protein